MKPILSATLSISGTVLTDNEKYLLEESNPMGVTLFKRNIESFEQVSALTRSIKEVIGRNNVMIAVDQEGGQTSRFDPPLTESFLAQYSIGMLPPYERMEATSLQAHLISDVLYKAGVNLNYAPCLDIRYPTTGDVLKSRSFSTDKNVVAECGRVMIETYKSRGIIPCMKHLPGHGRVVSDPHLELPVINDTLEQIAVDFYPFQENAIACPMGMTAHILIPAIDEKWPITQSKIGIDTLIRGEIGFDGLLISDGIEMHALKGTLRENTLHALDAGCDAVCFCRGDEAGMREVIDACRPLSDKGLERLAKCLNILNNAHRTPENAQARYAEIKAHAPISKDDYDAVEVLNKMHDLDKIKEDQKKIQEYAISCLGTEKSM